MVFLIHRIDGFCIQQKASPSQTICVHRSLGLLQAQLLLVLQRAERGHGAEVMMKGRCAHAGLFGVFVDSQRLAEIAFEPFDGMGDLLALTSRGGDLRPPHISTQQHYWIADSWFDLIAPDHHE